MADSSKPHHMAESPVRVYCKLDGNNRIRSFRGAVDQEEQSTQHMRTDVAAARSNFKDATKGFSPDKNFTVDEAVEMLCNQGESVMFQRESERERVCVGERKRAR